MTIRLFGALLCGAALMLPSMAYAQSLEFTPQQKSAMAEIIRLRGFNCPTFVSAGARGEDARGRVIRVRCGPASGKGTMDQFQQFRVTLRNDGSAIVASWD